MVAPHVVGWVEQHVGANVGDAHPINACLLRRRRRVSSRRRSRCSRRSGSGPRPRTGRRTRRRSPSTLPKRRSDGGRAARALERSSVVHRRHHRLVQLGADHAGISAVVPSGCVLDRDKYQGDMFRPTIEDVGRSRSAHTGVIAETPTCADDLSAARLEHARGIAARATRKSGPRRLVPRMRSNSATSQIGDDPPLGGATLGIRDERVEDRPWRIGSGGDDCSAPPGVG